MANEEKSEVKNDEEILADVIKDMAENGLYNQEKVNNAITAICEDLGDLTRLEALKATEAVYSAIRNLYFGGKAF